MYENEKELCRAIVQLGPFDQVPAMADAIERAGAGLGWQVTRGAEVWYVGTSGRRRGLIDLVCRASASVVAIELDRRTPRGKSVAKLMAVPDATARLVVLRESPVKPYRMGEVVVFATKAPASITRALARAQASRRTG